MTLTEIRRALQNRDIQPSRGLGQNFLHDQNLARWFATQVASEPVVEIGPGLGSITEYLLASEHPVIAIEHDDRLADFLEEKFSNTSLRLIRGDATRLDLRPLHATGARTLIGNLPYSVSTSILQHFCTPVSPINRIIAGLQKEVAERITARPGTRDYGAMTVRMARRWHSKIIHHIPPQVYYPQPQVESAVVEMTRRPSGEILPCDEEALDKLLTLGFSQRRKQLKNVLRIEPGVWASFCETHNLSLSARAEELSPEIWTALANTLQPMSRPPGQNQEEVFDVVDDQDHVIGQCPRHEVHARNLRHRAVHILIQNNNGEWFLQKRSPWKDMNPSLWDSSAAGHVDAGETYLEAAKREVREELGLNLEPEPFFKIPCSEATGFEFIHVFRAHHEGPFHLCSSEIDGGAFFPSSLLEEWYAKQPGDFTPVFRMCLEHGLDGPNDI